MPDPDQPRRSILDAATLRGLLRRLEQTDVDELDVEIGVARLSIRRQPGRFTVVQQPGRSPQGQPGIPVAAPLTGAFYSRSSPDQPAFVSAGDRVVPGQVVGLIETMKLFNEVRAELAGEVVSIAVEDGDLVEAGQPLMFIRPPEGDGA